MVSAAASFFFAVGAFIFAGILGLIAFKKFKISDLFLLMLLGIAIGPFGLKLVSPEIFGGSLTIVATLGLMMVLFNEGLNLTYEELKEDILKISGFSLFVYVLTAGCIAAVVYFFLDPTKSIIQALIIGIALGAPGPSVFIPVYERLTLDEKLRKFLILEGVIADSIAIILATSLALLLPAYWAGSLSSTDLAGELFKTMAIAVVIGIMVGFTWREVLSKYKEDFHYLLTLAVAFITYSIGAFVGTSGILAVFTFGVVAASTTGTLMKLKLTEIKQFQNELTFLMKIFFLIYLGMFFDTSFLTNVSFVSAAVLIIIAMLVARFIAVKLFRIGSPEESWATILVFPRALAAAVLTITLVEAKVVTLTSFLSISFLIIILTNLVTTVAMYLHERKRAKAPVKTGQEMKDEKVEVLAKARTGILGPGEKAKLVKAVDNALKQIHQSIGAEMTFTMVLNKGKPEIFAADEKAVKTFGKNAYKDLKDFAQEAVERNSFVQVNDIGVLPNTTTDVRSILVLPIHHGGTVIGVIGAANKKGKDYFEEDDINLLSVIRDGLETAIA